MSASQQDVELEQAKKIWELARDAVVNSNVNLGYLINSQFALIKSLILVKGCTYEEANLVFQQMLEGGRQEHDAAFKYMMAKSDEYREALQKAGKFSRQ